MIYDVLVLPVVDMLALLQWTRGRRNPMWCSEVVKRKRVMNEDMYVKI